MTKKKLDTVKEQKALLHDMFDPLQIKEIDMATMELRQLDYEFQHLTRLEMQDIIKTKEKEVKDQEEVATDRLEIIGK